MQGEGLEIIGLNNQAVGFLHHGDFANALKASRSALVELQQVSSSWGGEENAIRVPFSTPSVLPVKLAFKGLLDTYREGTSSTFLFDRAFVLSPAQTVEHWSLISAVVLYNTALIKHVSGMMGSKTGENLKNAMKLYQMAAGSVASHEIVHPQDRILLLALFNNLGHIHLELMQTTDAHVCFQQVRACLASIQAFENDILVDFHWNVMFWNQNRIAPAA